MNIHPDVNLKACNTVISSRITCVSYVPPNKGRRTGSSLKHRHLSKDLQPSKTSEEKPTTATTGESLFDIDSSDDEETMTQMNHDEHGIFDASGHSILLESDCHSEQQDTREATMWIGTDDGVSVSNRKRETSDAVWFG